VCLPKYDVLRRHSVGLVVELGPSRGITPGVAVGVVEATAAAGVLGFLGAEEPVADVFCRAPANAVVVSAAGDVVDKGV
jgi:hypothetical protein